jgi:putative sterol carrier protein
MQMAVFKSAADAEQLLGGALIRALDLPEVREKFEKANLKILLHYTDPDFDVAIDSTERPPMVRVGTPSEEYPNVLTLSCDTGHKFWSGQLNMTKATVTGQIKVSGSMAKLMGLVPAVKPVFPVYQDLARELGYDLSGS